MNGITKKSKLVKDPFEPSEFSIAWAKDHLAELQRQTDAFLQDEDACAHVVETSSNGIWQMIKFKLCKPMPRPLRGHAGDAAINMRNALDQAICSVRSLAGLSTHSSYFPIAKDVAQLEDTLTKGWSKGLPQEISDIVRGCKPYKGGNDLLWALNKLTGTNKHGILRPVMLSNSLIQMSGFGLGTYIFTPPRWDSDKDELVLAKVPVGHEFEFNYEAAFFVAFNEIEFIDGKEVLSVLHELVDMVEGIVMAIKAESKRIGLV